MGVPIVAAGASFLSKKLLKDALKRKMIRKEIANNPSFYKTAADPNKLRVAKLTGNAGDLSGSGLGVFSKNLAKYTAAGVGGVGVGNSIEAMTQQPNGGDLHPRVEAMDRLRNGGGMTVLEKGVPEEIHGDAYVSQDERDMINHFSRIDSMNLSQKAREMLKEDYLRNRTGAAKTEEETQELLRGRAGAAYTNQEVGDPFNTGRLMERNPHFKGMYPDVEPEYPIMDEPIQEIDTFMGMPRGLRKRR